jgi:hypothetical protein
MDMIDGIIVGAAAAAIGTIVAFKYLNPTPPGGAQPNQPMYAGNPQAGRPYPVWVEDTLAPTAMAPLQQTMPNTEAAYNVQPVTFEHAFGPGVNQPAEEAVMPQ